MNTSKLIDNYKSDDTPLKDNADIIYLYFNDVKSTSLIEHMPVYLTSNLFEDVNLIFTTLDIYLSEKKDRKYIELYMNFLKMWESHKIHFVGLDERFVFENIQMIINSFLLLNPNYFTFDLTTERSVFFQALINKYNVYFELYFTNDSKDVNAIVNIYQNGVCIFTSDNSIEYIFPRLTLIVKKNQYDSVSTPVIYGMSQSSIASTVF